MPLAVGLPTGSVLKNKVQLSIVIYESFTYIFLYITLYYAFSRELDSQQFTDGVTVNWLTRLWFNLNGSSSNLDL